MYNREPFDEYFNFQNIFGPSAVDGGGAEGDEVEEGDDKVVVDDNVVDDEEVWMDELRSNWCRSWIPFSGM